MIKIFHVFVILKISPLYNDEIHVISEKLIKILREVLYDKRIFKTMINVDLDGQSTAFHKSTRIKFFFSAGNSDRYCIRLDFPHDNVSFIHLNIDQPGAVPETGFPIDRLKRTTILSVISKDAFDKLFYEFDDLFWFRSRYKTTVSKLFGKNTEKSEYLLKLLHDQGHISIGNDSKESRRAISEFTNAFVLALIDGGFKNSPYGDVTKSDEYTYQYYLFRDYIFETVMKLRHLDVKNTLGINKKSDVHYINQELDYDVRVMFEKYIQEKLSDDIKLNDLLKSKCELDVFLKIVLIE